MVFHQHGPSCYRCALSGKSPFEKKQRSGYSSQRRQHRVSQQHHPFHEYQPSTCAQFPPEGFEDSDSSGTERHTQRNYRVPRHKNCMGTTFPAPISMSASSVESGKKP